MLASMAAVLIAGVVAKRQLPPEIVGAPSDWVNSRPLSLKSLKGKVVLLDFWEYTCVNCVRTFPYLNEWYRRYNPYGFEIVAIHTPEFEFSKRKENVAAAAKRFGFQFPVLLDNERKNWDRYKIIAWPTKILLDAHGVAVEASLGEGKYAAMEAAIQRSILAIRPDAKLPPVMEPLRDTDREGAVCHSKTPEIFCGERGFREGRFPQEGAKIGQVADLSFAEPKANQLNLDGRWRFFDDHVEAVNPGAGLRLTWDGTEINAVIRPEQPVTIEVLQNGKPVAPKSMAKDLAMIDGRTVLRADKPRMYAIIANPEHGRNDLELRVLGSGFRLYTFSFATSCMYPAPGENYDPLSLKR